MTIDRIQAADGTLRFQFASLVIILMAAAVAVRLFFFMVIEHAWYVAMAEGTHEVSAQLNPSRGRVFTRDSRSGERFPLALNKDVFTVFVDTRQFDSEEDRKRAYDVLNETFQFSEEKKMSVLAQIQKDADPYEVIEQKVEESVVDMLREKKIDGIGFVRVPVRYYPEKDVGAHIIGFVGKTADGADVGRYGIEGYFEKELAGIGGFFQGLTGAKGDRITLGSHTLEEPQDGADIVLTIDRTIQYKTCEYLYQGVIEHKAVSGAAVVMDPSTGAILALCSVPEFDPNAYSTVSSPSVFNNTAIFQAYEPGSVFKAVTMSAALNEKLINPSTPFFDPGFVDGGCTKNIKNANEKKYGDVTMTGVMENSINTGLVYIANLLGKERLKKYITDFGFGVKTGITLDTEESGDVSTLSKNKGDKIDCYGSTASFGQGITATPIQLASAYSAIANGGTLYQPYVVDSIMYADGAVEVTKPNPIKTVLSPSAAQLMSAILVSVIDNGHTGSARIPQYYVAGKTGTAQIAGPGGYGAETNHTFIGYAPASKPKFVVLVKYEKPQRVFADSTAAPTFKKIATFLLDYYSVAPER